MHLQTDQDLQTYLVQYFPKKPNALLNREKNTNCVYVYFISVLIGA